MSLLTSQAASREYATRPPDERFESLDALVAQARSDKAHSIEKVYSFKDLRAVATAADTTSAQNGSIVLASPNGQARFTHWSFGQLCRSIGAPGTYLRGLPPTLAADCLNFGMKHTPPATDANLLVQAPNGQPDPIIRACTSEQYDRVWDVNLYDALNKEIMQDGKWSTPPTWSGEPAGVYRGDRDSFVVVTNGGSIVTDPSLRSGGGTFLNPAMRTTPAPPTAGPTDGMYRGLLIRNSEVGASSVVIEQVLFRYICGNHMLWGAILDRSFRRRHIGSHTERDVIREISKIAWNWTTRTASQDEAIIRGLIDHQIATTKEGVIDELRALGATIEQATQAYDLCERKESASPRSFWGAAQGLTRLSQETSSGYQDTRYLMDQLAAKVLSRGAKLVRV